MRFEFDSYGFSCGDRIKSSSDFAADVSWSDVVAIIAALAQVARHERDNSGKRPDELPLSETETAVIAAITALAKQIGINTEPEPAARPEAEPAGKDRA